MEILERANAMFRFIERKEFLNLEQYPILE